MPHYSNNIIYHKSKDAKYSDGAWGWDIIGLLPGKTALKGRVSMDQGIPLISIIVPVFNVEKYLRQCLDSVLWQTYQNLEIILVDDGSNDKSGEICDEYAEKYSNVFVIHKKNAGLGMARNTGLEHITGKYVTFVDSDDWLSSDLLEVLYNNLISNNVDFCKSGFQRVKNDGTVVSVAKYKNEIFGGDRAKKELLPRIVGSSPSQHDGVEMAVCAVLYNAEIIKFYGIRFPSERKLISEDLVFNIDYMQYANGACIIDAVSYNYRVNDNSLTRSYRPDRYKASAHFYSEMAKKLKNYGYDDMTMLRLKRIFFVYVRMSIAQETKTVSGLSSKQNRENIKAICNDPLLRNIIKSYPVNKLEFRQKMFLRLIKWKAVEAFHILAEAGVI